MRQPEPAAECDQTNLSPPPSTVLEAVTERFQRSQPASAYDEISGWSMQVSQANMPQPNPAPELEALIGRARRRASLHAAIDVMLVGAISALAVFVLVLITGSGILHWGWCAAAAVAGSVWAWAKQRRRRVDSYRTAQRIDNALESKDLLSTAWHFAGSPGHCDFVDSVLRQAGETASTADVETLLPWRMPRKGYVAAGLLAVCLVLLGVRLGVLKTLDLRAGLAEVRFDTVTGASVAADKKMASTDAARPFEGVGIDIPGYEAASLTGSEKQEQFQQLDVDSNEPGGSGQKGQRSADGQQGEGGEAAENGDEPSADEAPTGSQDPSRAPGSGSQSSKQDKPNSLMDKMRDAMASLMDKLGMEQLGGDGKQSASNKSSQPGQGQKKDGKGQQGQSKNAQAEADGEQSDAQGEGQQAQQTKAQSGQPQEQPSGDPRSGMGTQDGRKETELAQDVEAMGKLSDLFGRRSLNVKGEVMVEVTKSKNQGLRTPLVDRQAVHSESGGEVSRDEVPLHLQEYVQRYYERVRKPAAAEAAKQ